MSIAISVILRPSKILRFCAISFAFLLLSIAIYIGSVKTLSLLNQLVLMTLCCFAAWRNFIYNQHIAKKNWHIHIDGQGKIRCQSGLLKRRFSSTAQINTAFESNPFELEASSTLWTHALFLRLHNSEESVRINLIIFPDALSQDEFRRLSIACKWIVAHPEAKSLLTK